jgi:hypothetical protein
MFNCINCSKEVNKKSGKYCSHDCQQTWQRAEKLKAGVLDPRCIKKVLLKERGEKCEECGITNWNGKRIMFDMDHIDGDHNNNDFSNLRLICPNCHSQTDTYKGKNKGRGRPSRMERFYAGKSY